MIRKIISRLTGQRRQQQNDPFWKRPEHWMAALYFDDQKTLRASGMVREDLALLQSIPPVVTGYGYRDIVSIRGPIGSEYFRDDPIPQFMVTGLHSASSLETYVFKAILPTSKSYFYLLDAFKGDDRSVLSLGANANN